MAGGSSPLYGRLSETVVMGRGQWLVVVIACKTRFTLVNDPDNYIRIAHVGYPDVLWSGRIYGSRPAVYALKVQMRVTRMTMRAMCHCKMRATCHCKMRATCHSLKTFLPVIFVFCNNNLSSSDFLSVSVKLGLKNVFEAESYFICPRRRRSWEIYRQTERKGVPGSILHPKWRDYGIFEWGGCRVY
ncbi:hypothetical protein CK203_004404 [Vitis vinifera]|uniref:Uncharacterized protein n=1 Tax=Vitis vinifera TaxID=29760 RepID=A0A438KAB5_VITVI|nr:hypothetical protein CK203_004404 [Vitis vinifera]